MSDQSGPRLDHKGNVIPEDARIYSMSAIQTYERCPKKFQIEFLIGWEDQKEQSEALQNGTSFHKLLQNYALEQPLDSDAPLYDTAREFVKNRPMPEVEDICIIPGTNKLAADEPVFLRLFDNIYLRCSFDLVYVSGETLVIRDYKTFSKAPSFNIDLDFQGRTYLSVARQVWPGFKNYKFEHEMVRNEAPGTAHGTKPVKYWGIDECYFYHSMTPPEEESRADWNELMETILELDNNIEDSHPSWRRRPQKGGGYLDCNNCSVKQLCIADKQGNLDEQTLQIIGRKRDEQWTIRTT